MTFAFALLFPLLLPGLAGSLTIYRIGGAEEPLPEVAQREGVGVERVSWAEFADGFGGETRNLSLTGGRIGPVRLGSEDNLSLGAKERGGGVFITKTDYNETTQEFAELSIDGDPSTGFTPDEMTVRRLDGQYILRLGGQFPVNRVRFFPTTGHPERVLETFVVMAYSPDPSQPSGYSVETVAKVGRGQENLWPVVEITFPTRIVEWFRMWVDGWYSALDYVPTHNWEIAEFEVYGEGYVPEASYTSRVLDLQAPGSLARLRWSGFREGRAAATIRMRTGADADPNRYWRYTGRGDEKSFLDEEGAPLTFEAYRDLSTGRAGITTDLDQWSDWVGFAFEESGAAGLALPGLGPYLQVSAAFVPAGMDGAAVDFLELWVSQPRVAGRLVAEVWPVRVEPGEVAAFVYALRPTLSSLDSGFDRLVLSTPGEFVALDSVRIGGEPVPLLAEEIEPHRATLSLPRMEGLQDSKRPVEVFFRARVFRLGTRFAGQVFDSERPLDLELGLGQPVEEGDATFALDGNRATVDIGLTGGVLQWVGVRPSVLTPNGDGVNDRVYVEYTLLKMVGAGEVTVDIHDLAGRRVRQLFRGSDSSGQYAVPWDGGDQADHVVVPGLYVYQVRVDTDAGSEQRGGVIAVAW